MTTSVNSKIVGYLYRYHTKQDLVEDYCRDLKATGKKQDIQHAEKLLEYWSIVTNPVCNKRFKVVSEELYTSITKMSHDLLLQDIHAHLIGREKSLARVDDKILSTLLENDELPEELREENPLDRIRDFLASRIIVFHDWTRRGIKDAVKQAYAVGNATCDFFLNHPEFEVLEANPTKDTGFNQEEYPWIFVPKKSGLRYEYQKYFKDYILYPKKNGYQSLHMVVRDKVTGAIIEIQIRTHAQDDHAEANENASHSMFRSVQNRTLIKHDLLSEICFEKIQIPGFSTTRDALKPYRDFECILDSRSIFNIYK